MNDVVADVMTTVSSMLNARVSIAGEFEDEGDGDSDSGSEMGGGSGAAAAQDLCLPSLDYLKRCSQMLSRMWTMPACPVFNGAQR